jgi:hypothetical protein
VIACGALARELLEVVRRNRIDGVRVECLPAELHNRPDHIPGAVRAKLEEAGEAYDRVFVAYADCGTGGALDRVLDEYGVERLPGAHCYQFYAGIEQFLEIQDEEIGTLYLTDFLVRNFDRLVWQGLGLDRWPELRDDYFGNYTRVLHLAQTDDPTVTEQARAAAERLDLRFERRLVGYGAMEPSLVALSVTGGAVP